MGRDGWRFLLAACAAEIKRLRENEPREAKEWYARFGNKPCARIELRKGDKKFFSVTEIELTRARLAELDKVVLKHLGCNKK